MSRPFTGNYNNLNAFNVFSGAHQMTIRLFPVRKKGTVEIK
jgi:hypothetical protein